MQLHLPRNTATDVSLMAVVKLPFLNSSRSGSFYLLAAPMVMILLLRKAFLVLQHFLRARKKSESASLDQPNFEDKSSNARMVWEVTDW